MGSMIETQDLIGALRDKDAALFIKLGRMPIGDFWREWKKVYPEDFPQDGMSLAAASSVMPKQVANGR